MATYCKVPSSRIISPRLQAAEPIVEREERSLEHAWSYRRRCRVCRVKFHWMIPFDAVELVPMTRVVEKHVHSLVSISFSILINNMIALHGVPLIRLCGICSSCSDSQNTETVYENLSSYDSARPLAHGRFTVSNQYSIQACRSYESFSLFSLVTII